MIKFVHKGSFKNTEKLFENAKKSNYKILLHRFGQMGVDVLAQSTPVDTGKTASSWSYEIVENKGSISIIWSNNNVVNGYANIAVLLQYGHGTRNGGYVQGRDYINPAMQPLFDKIANEAWEEVISK